MISLGIWAAVE